MSETDKTPAHVCQVKVGDSRCAAQEKARIVALIREHIALWAEGQWIGIPVDDDDDFDEVIALKRLLSDVEDTGHE